MVKVKFIKSPVGLLKLGYITGQEAMLNKNQAEEAIDAGLAVLIEQKPKRKSKK